jgi:hypothetical protein
VSIKRTKKYVPAPRDRDVGSGPSWSTKAPKTAEPEPNWDEQVATRPDEDFVPYSLKGTFQKGAFLLHPVFGKWVVAVEGRHIVVLCQEGKKKLAHAL